MKIGLYCSAAEKLPGKWTDAAEELGRWIGRNSCELVYGGVDAGLMTVTAREAKNAGAKITGVVPARRYDRQSPLNDVTIRVPDLSERKSVMQTLADVFIALPGGYGTLDELISTFAHLNFTGRGKMLYIYNPDGIFDPLLEQLELFVTRGLMKTECLDKIAVAGDMTRLLSMIEEKHVK